MRLLIARIVGMKKLYERMSQNIALIMDGRAGCLKRLMRLKICHPHSQKRNGYHALNGCLMRIVVQEKGHNILTMF